VAESRIKRPMTKAGSLQSRAANSAEQGSEHIGTKDRHGQAPGEQPLTAIRYTVSSQEAEAGSSHHAGS